MADNFFNMVIFSELVIRLNSWIIRGKPLKNIMKRLLKFFLQFVQKEWFLLITVTAIAIIIVLFEIL
jgi:hypothetical protein